MSVIKLTLQCLFTPRLYKIYRNGPNENHYHPRFLEKCADNLILSAVTVWNMSLYVSPLIAYFVYKMKFFTTEGLPGFVRLVSWVGFVVAASLLARAVGRATNSKYQQFMRALMAPEAQRLEIVRQYDFEFGHFPVTYVAPKFTTAVSDDAASVSWYRRGPTDLLAALLVRVFGLRIIYPGTLAIVQTLLWSELLRGRTSLVQAHHGKRHKIRAGDGNVIDAMFVDNRVRLNGKTLVVCCEGNAGFYEIGIMTTPMAGGYSVLGWNHPGFGGSTGQPYPKQEQAAIEAVMEFAQELGFALENIVVFGWSIGGYTAAWAARKYPDIQCLVLDATFDDLLPLALARMPSSWARLVTSAVRNYVNLNVGELVVEYPGPLHLVRRANDEILCLRDGDMSTNCANTLLHRIIRHRHPSQMTDQVEDGLTAYFGLNSVLEKKYENVPMSAHQLVDKYMQDYNSSHCTNLPIDYFVIPQRNQ